MSKGKTPEDKSGPWIVGNIPRGLMKKATSTDVVKGQPIKALLIEA
jgi:hypothetical protein